MTDKLPLDNIPLPEIRQRRRGVSLVWFVPFIALLLGGWLVYQSWMSSGPLVTISFESVAGVEAGVTRIKYRDVSIGQVESVTIGEDFKSVLVTARLDRQVSPYLNESTKFWIERPRIGTAGISGLGTLFSGAHIGFEASVGGEERRFFDGVEQPPIVDANADGIRVVLTAVKAGSLSAGSPIYYKSFKVGKVETVKLDSSFNSVVIQAFIDSPFDRLVHLDSRFWNVSGVSADISAEGVSVDFQSVESLLIGGIEFDSPSLGKDPQPIVSNHRFQLFDSLRELGAIAYTHKLFYFANFEQSVRGLSVDAPVEYRGLKIGRVVNISSRYKKFEGEILLPILIEIEPERLGIKIDENESVEDAYRDIANLGFFAKLEIANLITGQLFVSLDFYEDKQRSYLPDFDGFKQLPTVSTDLNRIAANIGETLEKIKQLEIEQLITNINDAVVTTTKTMERVSGLVDNAGQFVKNTDASVDKVVKSLDDTLDQSKQLLQTGETMFAQGQTVMQSLDEGSATRYALDQTLKELQAAARSLRTLTETIEKKPNSLIFGKQNKN